MKKIVVNREEALHFIVLSLLTFYILLAHWVWYGRGIQETIILSLCIYAVLRWFINSCRSRVMQKDILFSIFIVFVLLVITFGNILQKGQSAYFSEVLKPVCGGFIIYLYLTLLWKNNSEFVKKFLDIAFKWFNLYMFVNSIVMLIQYRVPYFFMNKAALSSVGNSYYHDQITGLLGINGTTRWNLASCFLVLLNFCTYYKTKKRNVLVYNIFYIAMSLFLCMLNSAKAYFVMLVMVLMIYFFLIRKVKLSAKVKYIVAIVMAVFVMLICYSTIDFVRNFIDDLVSDKVSMYLSGSMNTLLRGNDDRAIAIYFAIENGGMWGNGIGSLPLQTRVGSVKHFGISSASSYIYYFGVVGYIAYSFALANMAVAILGNKSKGTVLVRVIMGVLFILGGYLLPIFSGFALPFLFFLICYVFAFDTSME